MWASYTAALEQWSCLFRFSNKEIKRNSSSLSCLLLVFIVEAFVLKLLKLSHPLDFWPAAGHPSPPDVEPYVWYHQSRDKTSGFYSIKLVLSQLCWEIMHQKTFTICLLGQKIEYISLPLYGWRDVCSRTSWVRRYSVFRYKAISFIYIIALGLYVLKQYGHIKAVKEPLWLSEAQLVFRAITGESRLVWTLSQVILRGIFFWFIHQTGKKQTNIWTHVQYRSPGILQITQWSF